MGDSGSDSSSELYAEDNDLVEQAGVGSNISTPDIEFFPTPIEEEPSETITARYLGCVPVTSPSGIDILNDAIDRIVFENVRIKERIETGVAEQEDDEDHRSLMARKFYDVDCKIVISPTSINVETLSGEYVLITRVRYLSFIGISRNNPKTSCIIVQIADGIFEAHAFDFEPNAYELTKKLEEACRRRYEKCLDAHKRRLESQKQQNGSSSTTTSGAKVSLESVKNMFSKILFK